MSGMQTAVVAAMCVGILCGFFGTFVVVRRMALTGDMISHAVLPGVVAGLVMTGGGRPLVVTACAVAAGMAGSYAMRALLRHTRLKPDAALALVLSVFFAMGVAMVSMFRPSGAMAFLYGQIAAIDGADLVFLAAATLATLVMGPLLFRQLALVSFDPAFARMLGVPVRAVEVVFHGALAVAIVLAMQAVGVVLVTAMLVTPAAAARFCTPSLARGCLLACALGAAGALGGVAISATRGGLPTGPLIALCLAAAFATAALAGPHHGWLVAHQRRARSRRRIEAEDFLKALWHRDAGTPGKPPPVARGAVVRKLVAEGKLSLAGGRKFELTGNGRAAAAKLVRAHRLWERYLVDVAEYPAGNIHEEAERAEHWIDEASSREIAARLGAPALDPHGSRIPPAQGEEVPE